MRCRSSAPDTLVPFTVSSLDAHISGGRLEVVWHLVRVDAGLHRFDPWTNINSTTRQLQDADVQIWNVLGKVLARALES